MREYVLGLGAVAQANFLYFRRLARVIGRRRPVLLYVDCLGATGASLETLNRLTLIASELSAAGGRLVLRRVSREFAAVAELVGLDLVADVKSSSGRPGDAATLRARRVAVAA